MQLIDIQSSSQAFRQAFQSQTMTYAFVHAFRSFVTAVAGATLLSQDTVRILEKLSHFALTLSLDQNVNAGQKEEVGHSGTHLDYAGSDTRAYSYCKFCTPPRPSSIR